MRRLPLLLIFFMITALYIAAPPSNTRAQDPLPQTITTLNNQLTVRYPAEWHAEEFLEQIYLTNSAGGVNGLDAANLPAATVLVAVGVMRFTDIEGLDSTATFDDLLTYIEATIAAESEEVPVDLTANHSLTLNNHRAHLFAGTQGGNETYLLAMDVGGGTVMGLQAISLAGEMANFTPTLERIAASIIYTPPTATVIEGRVIWQQTGSAEFAGGSLTELSDLTVAPDDTLYIANEEFGIAVFGPDGTFRRLIFHHQFVRAQDVTLAPDGTLYAVGGLQLVYHLDTEGNLLRTWGATGSQPDQFAADGPYEIEITSDGSIVTLNNQEGPDGSTITYVQFWDGTGQFLGHFTPLDEDGNLAIVGFATLAIGPDDTLYLAEFGEIYRYALDGTLLDSHLGAATLFDTSVSDLEIAPDGSLFVATYSGIIYHLNAGGGYLRQFGTLQIDLIAEDGLGVPFSAGEFSAPEGIALLSDGDIVVSDTNFDYWQVVRISFEN